jgi:PAS domain S-box-containing protein
MRIDAAGIIVQILVEGLFALNFLSLCIAIYSILRAKPLLQSWVWFAKAIGLGFWAVVGFALVVSLHRSWWGFAWIPPRVTGWTFIVAMPAGSLTLCIAFIKLRRMLAQFVLGMDVSQSGVIADAVIGIDANGLVVQWGQPAETIFGVRRDEILGHSLDRIMPRRYRASHNAAIGRVAVTGEMKLAGRIIKGFGLRRNGEEFPLEIRLTHWEGNEPDDPVYVGLVRDLTADNRSAIEL